MVSAEPSLSERFDGLAVFAGAAFALGLGLIAALERVGAPDGFVEALGPLLAFVGLCVVGIATRAPSLPDFLAARRSTPAFYGGLAFAATAAGLAIAKTSEAGDPLGFPWLATAAGLVGAALVVAPGVRAANASAAADVLATCYPAAPLRVVFAILMFCIGLATALAGFELSTDALSLALGTSRRLADGIVMAALFVSIAPGGLKGAFWSDAASAGGALLIAAIGAGLAAWTAPAPFAPLAADLDAFAAAHGDFTLSTLSVAPADVAFGLALAGFVGFTSPAIGAASPHDARRAGAVGISFALLGLACAAVALPFIRDSAGGPSHTAKTMIACATWLPTLALARAGVLAAARAAGLDLATAYARLTVLSSRRIALIRLGMAAAIALCAYVSHALVLDVGRALDLALALGLAFVAPSLAMALWLSSRASSPAAAAALAAGVATLAARHWKDLHAPQGAELWNDALLAAAASLAAGLLVALIVPARRRRIFGALSDPFADLPLDPLD